MVLQVYVLKRPHVDEFLQKMGELFECVLFTASLAKVSLDPRMFSLHVPSSPVLICSCRLNVHTSSASLSICVFCILAKMNG